jgi:iron(III) transport system permease protein
LATQAFQFAKDEMVAESAAPSLMIILVSAVPVYFLHRIFGTK